MATATVTTGHRRGDAATETRARIVQAALDVFVEKGYAGARVQDIAARAELTPGALYVHFPNRSRLLTEAIVVEGRRIIATLVEGLGRIEPGDDRVARVLTDLLVDETSLLDRLMVEAFALAARDAEARRLLERTFEGFDEMIAGRVRAAVETGAAPRSLSVDAITTFFSTWIMGIIVHRAVGRPRPDDAAMFELARRLFNGLADDRS